MLCSILLPAEKFFCCLTRPTASLVSVGEVKEARDRYANMEVSHLLTRFEHHQGPCILTSNLRSNLDPCICPQVSDGY